MGGGGSGSSQTSNQYMPEDIQLRRMGLDYANKAGGLGGRFSGPSPGAGLDPWTSDTRNNYYGALNQNLPISGQQWMQDSRNAAGFNPMIGLAGQQMPMAQGYNDAGATEAAIRGMMGYGGPGAGGQYANTPGAMAYDPTIALQAAQKNLSTVMGPQLANAGVAGGSNPMSGAYAEAMTNAGTQMAMPINQQVMQNQANWYQPQLQGAIQGGLAQQGAQNQAISQGLGGQIQGQLGQQNAQNQYLGQGYGGMLQGGLNQQQNTFNQAMQTPQGLNQLLQGLQGNYGQQMGLASMGQNAQQQDFLRQQALWQQIVSGLYGSGGMGPMSQTTNTSGGGGGFSGGGAMGGAASGAMIGTALYPGIGTAVGALGGGIMGGFCWVADALYGEGSEEAIAARAWVSEGWQGEDADEFRVWYAEHGEAVADALRLDKGFASQHEDCYREMFDEFVEKGRGYLSARDVRTV